MKNLSDGTKSRDKECRLRTRGTVIGLRLFTLNNAFEVVLPSEMSLGVYLACGR